MILVLALMILGWLRLRRWLACGRASGVKVVTEARANWSKALVSVFMAWLRVSTRVLLCSGRPLARLWNDETALWPRPAS